MSTTVEEIEKTKTSKDKKDELLLDSLEIKGYRCFEHLTIEKLGRVNLIVGKNNVGKTALLEALWIYARRGNFKTLFDLLFSRDEVPVYVERASPLQIKDIRLQKEDLISETGNLFFGRPKLNANSRESILVSSNKASLSVHTTRMINEDGKPTNDFSIFESIWNVRPFGLIIVSVLREEGEEKRAEFYSFENLQSLMLEPPPESLASNFISSNILENESLVRTWDDALRKGLEENAIKFLRIIEPKIEYVNFVGTSENSGMRYPIASNRDSSKRVALKSYGEGMTRLLGISLALVQCRNGMLLIDEIESGLHYSVLPDVWKLIFKTAKDLNVQVFATTHSKDCIEAFAAVADESPEDGMFIRLERQGEKIVARTIEEERLVDAVNFNVEVR
jgi:predicted ATP-dependent endonuclease of OLD family